MDRKNIIIIVVTVLIVGGAIYFIFTGVIPSPRTGPVSGMPKLEGTAAVPGTSPVTDKGQVINPLGEAARLDVEAGSLEAPQQSNTLGEEEIPAEAIKLVMSDGVITPPSFEVRAGAPVTLFVSVSDNQAHVFKFSDPALSAVVLSVSPYESRAITFNAPAKGTYTFYCDVPGHRGRGEEGTMIVR